MYEKASSNPPRRLVMPWVRAKTPILPITANSQCVATTPSSTVLIDLIPSTAWGSNVRSRYPGEWDVFRRDCYRAAGHRCELCAAPGRMECHEVWTYEKPPVQHLERLICLCGLCHSAQHYGLSAIRGITDEVDAHMRRVNGWSQRQLDAHIKKAFKVWGARNEIKWVTETVLLDQAVISIRSASINKD